MRKKSIPTPTEEQEWEGLRKSYKINEIMHIINSRHDLLEAARTIIESIKWSGDINQVNLAPKISKLAEAVKRATEIQ